MDSLSEETWDLVIAGTGIPQALLALSLSRSSRKILHVDKNNYYGGEDAGLSLEEAEGWVQTVGHGGSTKIRDARKHSISPPPDSSGPTLGPSRAYTLSLKPQIIYAQSACLPSLVSSQVHTQLEFLAVGSWWVHKDGKSQRIPGSREDVFADESLSMREKRGLMKFLRHVMQDAHAEETSDDNQEQSLHSVLSSKFNISQGLQTPLLALALAPTDASSIDFEVALSRIRRHMRSMGYFGPGFGAVLAKYGGNAEIAQVGCRAAAVGGAVYLLGEGVAAIQTLDVDSTDDHQHLVQVELSNGVQVKSKLVVGAFDDLPTKISKMQADPVSPPLDVCHLISIVSDGLADLFPQTSDNGPVPASAIVLVDDGEDGPPIYLQVHSEDTGECPKGQCIIYTSTEAIDEHSKTRLEAAVHETFLKQGRSSAATVLWSMSYTSSGTDISHGSADLIHKDESGQIIAFPVRSEDLAFDDQVLDSVKAVWELVLGDEAERHEFMRFEEREQMDSEV